MVSTRDLLRPVQLAWACPPVELDRPRDVCWRLARHHTTCFDHCLSLFLLSRVSCLGSTSTSRSCPYSITALAPIFFSQCSAVVFSSMGHMCLAQVRHGLEVGGCNITSPVALLVLHCLDVLAKGQCFRETLILGCIFPGSISDWNRPVSFSWPRLAAFICRGLIRNRAWLCSLSLADSGFDFCCRGCCLFPPSFQSGIGFGFDFFAVLHSHPHCAFFSH